MSIDTDHLLKHVFSCGICCEIYNTPYTLCCGHTFCGECLLQWLPRSMTCPQCRAQVTSRPYCSYTIVEAIEHLQEKFTSQESLDHPGSGQEQELDKKFKKLKYEPIGPEFFDAEDQVERCVHCHWEIEDGRCWRCHPTDSDESGSDIFSSDEEMRAASARPASRRPIARGSNTIDSDSDEDSEHSSDRAFVEDDELEDLDENEFHNFGRYDGSDNEVIDVAGSESDQELDYDECEVVELASDDSW